MPVIVVVDDDAGTLLLVSHVLRHEGHEVLSAADGARGLELIRTIRPDLVVSDVNMPCLSGFGLLKAMRENPELDGVPVILLTSLQERAGVRQGMNLGADDYLTKPFSSQELRDAVGAQLLKVERVREATRQRMGQAVAEALEEEQRRIQALYADRLATPSNFQWPASHPPTSESVRFEAATVLYADICDYATWSRLLGAGSLGELIQRFYAGVGDTAQLFGAHHMQFVGDGLLCVFVDAGDTSSVNHAMRAARVALGLLSQTGRMETYVKQAFADLELPAFSLRLTLHSGPVAFAFLGGVFANGAQSTPVGATVVCALQIARQSRDGDMKISATSQVADLVQGRVRLGRRRSLQGAPHEGPRDLIEILGAV